MHQNNATAIKDEILKSYIEQIFNRYDTQGHGTLGANDITSFFNDLFRSLSISMVLTAQQSYEAIKTVYPNFTTTISRDELFQVFKVMLGLYFYCDLGLVLSPSLLWASIRTEDMILP